MVTFLVILAGLLPEKNSFEVPLSLVSRVFAFAMLTRPKLS